MSSAFTLAAVFDLAALLIVLAVIRDRRAQPVITPAESGGDSGATR
jgi:hypothetical protein